MACKVRDTSKPDDNDLAVLIYLATRSGDLDALIEDYNLQGWTKRKMKEQTKKGEHLLMGFAPSYFAESEHTSLALFQDAAFNPENLRKLASYREARTEMDEEEYYGAKEYAKHHTVEIARRRISGPPPRPRKINHLKDVAAIIRDAVRLEQYPAELNKLLPSHSKRQPDDEYAMLKPNKVLQFDYSAMPKHKKRTIRKWLDEYSPHTLPTKQH